LAQHTSLHSGPNQMPVAPELQLDGLRAHCCLVQLADVTLPRKQLQLPAATATHGLTK